MLSFDRIDASAGMGISKTDYFFVIINTLNRKFTFQPCLCDGCHDLMQKLQLSIFSIKNKIFNEFISGI